MGLFDFFKSKRFLEPAARVPALAPLLDAGANAWQVWPAFFASLRGQPDLRVDACATFAETYWMKEVAGSRAPRLDSLVGTDPASWLVVRAQVALAEGLEARGGGTQIQDEATFGARLRAARVDAERVAAADPTDAPAWAILLRIARGTGDDELDEHAYRNASQHAPLCYAVHVGRNNSLSARWGGSHEKQLAHARAVAATAPPGHVLAGLPVNALFFHVSHVATFDGKPKEARALAAMPHVIGEVNASCARSVDVPGHVPTVASFELRSMAAAVAWYAKNDELLRRQLAASGDVFYRNPWNQLAAKPEDKYVELRKQFGL